MFSENSNAVKWPWYGSVYVHMCVACYRRWLVWQCSCKVVPVLDLIHFTIWTAPSLPTSVSAS